VRNFLIAMLCLGTSGAPWGVLSGAELQAYGTQSQLIEACRNLPGHRQALQIQNLACLTPPDYYPSGPPLTISGVTFLGSGPFVTEDGYLWSFDAPHIMVVFPKGARAFGASFSSQTSKYRSSFLATIVVDGVQRFTFVAPTHPRSTFFGIVSTGSFTNITYDDGGGVWRTNFDGQALLGNPIMVLNEMPAPVLRWEKAPAASGTNACLLVWPAAYPGFAVQRNSSLTSPHWVKISTASRGCADNRLQIVAASEPAFYRLVYVPPF